MSAVNVGDKMNAGSNLKHKDTKVVTLETQNKPISWCRSMEGKLYQMYSIEWKTNLERLESFGYHQRAKIGSSDADVDYIGYLLAGVALPLARNHLRSHPN